MRVQDAMTDGAVTAGPGHTLRETCRIMKERKIGSVVVSDPEGNGPGILTERDIVRAVAEGADLDTATAADYLTSDATYAAPGWTLEDASEAMRRGGFRHLVVVEGDAVLGMISMRDIVRAWAPDHVRT